MRPTINRSILTFFFLFYSLFSISQQFNGTDSSKQYDSSVMKERLTNSDEGEVRKPKKVAGAAFRTDEEMQLTIYFLIFSAFVIVTASILLYKYSNDCNITFKYFIITLLIIGMLLLIIIGLNQDQISPAVGLFGTIAGYLLGRTDIVSQKKESTTGNSQTQTPAS